MKKICGTLTIGILAGILLFSIGVSSAWANETEEDKSETQVTEETTVTSKSEASVTTETELAVPSLKDGDFFYFIKITLENIQLLITADDIKEAQLLAKFAEERISEANALFAEGKDDLAKLTIEKAIKQQEKALALKVGLESEEESIIEESAGGQSDEEESLKTKSELDAKLSQNIKSLTKVIEKVENPKAKAAITKNIKKSLGKSEIQDKLNEEKKEQLLVEIKSEEESEIKLNLNTKVQLDKPVKKQSDEKNNRNK